MEGIQAQLEQIRQLQDDWNREADQLLRQEQYMARQIAEQEDIKDHAVTLEELRRVQEQMQAEDEGAPGPRPDYGPNYYGAFCRDLDGNKIEAVVISVPEKQKPKPRAKPKKAAAPAARSKKSRGGCPMADQTTGREHRYRDRPSESSGHRDRGM